MDLKSPLQDQKFFGLNLLDAHIQRGILYSIKQAHAQWPDIDAQVMWDQEEVEHF